MNEQKRPYRHIDYEKYSKLREEIDHCFIVGRKEMVGKLRKLEVERLVPRGYFDKDFDCLAYFVYHRPWPINEMINKGWKGMDFHRLGIDYLNYFLQNWKKLSSHDYEDGSAVLYFNCPWFQNETFTHIGIVSGDKIVSKFAHLSVFRHPLENVPSCFSYRVLNLHISKTLESDIGNHLKSDSWAPNTHFYKAMKIRDGLII